MLDVRRLRVLEAVDRYRTVNAAGDALHLSASAVSQQLSALAREVGCPVVERDGRNVRLTPAARVLLDHAAQLFAQLEALDSDLQAHRSGDVGRIRIGAFQTAARSLVVPAATALKGERPGLQLEVAQIDGPQAMEELAAGRLDIALGVEYVDSPPNADPRFSRVPLLHDQFSALLPADHPLAGRSRIRLADLSDDVWIGNVGGSPCHFVTMAACAAAGFSPAVRHHIDDWAIIIEMVAAGFGVSLVPDLVRPTSRPDVAVVALAGRPAARNIFALVRRGTEEAPGLAAVLSALRDAGRGERR